MFKTAYDTLACRAFQTRDITKALNLAIVEGEISPVVVGNTRIRDLYVVLPGNTDVPAFTHPFYVPERNIENAGRFFIDGRAYMKAQRDGEVVITSKVDYNFQINRSILNLHWFVEPRDLFNLGDIAPIVFCRWLTNPITNRLGLSPAEQIRVMTVTMFYWFSLFRTSNFEVWDESEKMAILRKLNRLTAIPTNLSMEVMNDIPVMPSLTDYIEGLKAVVGTDRTQQLNPALLYAMLGGSFFGLNAKETIAVATEHPPTFLSMINTTLASRDYHRSGLGQLVFDLNRKDQGANFTQNFNQLTRQYQMEE